jgi:hypothetical protein
MALIQTIIFCAALLSCKIGFGAEKIPTSKPVEEKINSSQTIDLQQIHNEISNLKILNEAMKESLNAYQKIAFEQVAFMRTLMQLSLAFLAFLVSVAGLFVKDLFEKYRMVNRAVEEITIAVSITSEKFAQESKKVDEYMNLIKSDIGEIRRRSEKEAIESALAILGSDDIAAQKQAVGKLQIYADGMKDHFYTILSFYNKTKDEALKFQTIVLLKNILPETFEKEFSIKARGELNPHASSIVPHLAEVDLLPFERFKELNIENRASSEKYLSYWAYYHIPGTTFISAILEKESDEKTRNRMIDLTEQYFVLNDLETVIDDIVNSLKSGHGKNVDTESQKSFGRKLVEVWESKKGTSSKHPEAEIFYS